MGLRETRPKGLWIRLIGMDDSEYREESVVLCMEWVVYMKALKSS
jgi:hypothetical protein